MPVTPRYWNGYRWVDLSLGGDRGAPLPHDFDFSDAQPQRIRGDRSAEACARKFAELDPAGFGKPVSLPPNPFLPRLDPEASLAAAERIERDPAIANADKPAALLEALGIRNPPAAETPVAQLLNLAGEVKP